MSTDSYLQELQRELLLMDHELKDLMILLDRGQSGRLSRPVIHMNAIARERLRTRLDFARSLIIKLATLLAIPPESPDFLSAGKKVVATHLKRLQKYRALAEAGDGADPAMGIQAAQALQQLQDSLQSIRELLEPAGSNA